MGTEMGRCPSEPGTPTTAGSREGGRGWTAARSPQRGLTCGTATPDFRAPVSGMMGARRSGLPGCGSLSRQCQDAHAVAARTPRLPVLRLVSGSTALSHTRDLVTPGPSRHGAFRPTKDRARVPRLYERHKR